MPVRNTYARLEDVKNQIGGGVKSDTTDPVLLSILENVSRGAEGHVGREIHSRVATRYFNGSGKAYLALTGDDLISVTTLGVDENDDGTYERVLVENTDYFLEPANGSHKYRVVLATRGTQIGAFVRGQRAIRIVGRWGYWDEAEAVTTLGAAVTDTTGTSLTVADGMAFSIGETVRVDSEEMAVDDRSGTTLTVTRGANGTTAATHSNGATVSRKRYPRAVEQAVLMQTARLYKRRESAFANVLNNTDLGQVTMFRGFDPDIQALLGPHVRMAVA